MAKIARITDEQVASWAAEASVDRRTVQRMLAGLPVRGLAGVRLRKVLQAYGVSA